MKKPRLLLFDGNNLIFRAFFAIRDLSTSNGVATNAVYGVLKSFRATINEFKPDYIIVCWDSGKQTFRHQQDDTYKANRPQVDNNLKVQFPIVQEALNCLQVPQITANGVECDDLIGTLATRGAAAGFKVTIVSSDKDFFQLCSEDINVYSFTVRKKDESGIVDVEYVRKNFQVEPSQLVDIKSLTGEKTDNITGVKGIGEKIATKLIKQHGTIFNVINVLRNNSVIPDRLKVIVDSIDIIANAYTLAKIKTDVDIPKIPVRPVEKLAIDEIQLRTFFETYEMKTFLREFNSWVNLFQYKSLTFN
jgi:DNA polymerase-1